MERERERERDVHIYIYIYTYIYIYGRLLRVLRLALSARRSLAHARSALVVSIRRFPIGGLRASNPRTTENWL